MMTNSQTYITIALITLVTALIRFLPFIIFPANRKPPLFIQYLGTVLPMAAISFFLLLLMVSPKFVQLPLFSSSINGNGIHYFPLRLVPLFTCLSSRFSFDLSVNCTACQGTNLCTLDFQCTESQ